MTLRRSWFVLGVAVLLTVVAGFLLLPTTHSSAQVQEGATMTVLRGQVAVVHTDGSAVQPAPSGTLVNAGDEIRTLGSTSALITFFAGTEIELDQNTIIAIEQVSKQGDRIDVSLKQAFGTTVNRVQTLTGSGSTYRIDAGGAVALVRGTTFVVIGPITTSSGTDVVILVCGADCSAVSTFAGCPLAPYVGYGVLVEKGQVVSPCMVFAVSHTADLTSAAFEAITTIEQQVQGDTDGVPAGQVQSGQQQEIETRNRRREEDDNQVVQAIVVPSPGAVPTVSINDVSGNEGNGLTFTVVLSFPSNQPVTVFYSTANGTATAPVDYTAASGFVVIPPGSTTGTIVIQTVADGTGAASIASPVPSGSVVSRGTVSAAAVEPPETFFVNLTSAVGATIGDGQGQGTIVDTGTLTLSINDVSVTEGTGATFTVTLSAASSQPVTVNYTTADGTGGGGAVAPGDYTAASNTLTIPAGQLSGQIVVPTIADAVVEPPENFAVNLTGATVATIADTQGVGTITDPGTLSLSINDASATEGSNVTFTVTLSAVSSQPVTVNFTTADGTGVGGAVAPGDYTATSNTLTIPAGATSGTIVIPTIADAVVEPAETFVVNLSNPTNGATITDGQGVGTITDPGALTLSINDAPAAVEGINVTFTVSLSAASSQPVTVDFVTSSVGATNPATAGACATAGVDYVAQFGTLTFPANSTTPQTITVVTCLDALDEASETFFANLTNPTVATIADAQGIGTITDDDPAPTISIADVEVNPEGTGTNPTAIFNVSLSAASGQVVTVDFVVGASPTNPATGGAACSTPGVDYVWQTATLTFPAGSTVQPINVTVCGDAVDELDETFVVNLSNPANATIADNQGVGTIRDDDTAVISINSLSQNEGTSCSGMPPVFPPCGITNFDFTVSLSTPSDRTVTVTYTTTETLGTAGGGAPGACNTMSGYYASADFENTSGTVTFAPGDVAETITVLVCAESLGEDPDTFFVDLNAPVTGGATLQEPTRGSGTILDDDGGGSA